MAALTSYGAFSQDVVVQIPDETFKNALLAIRGIDANGDGEITVAEAREFAGEINVSRERGASSKPITSLKGIEAFVNITELHCSRNKLTQLDVSKNTKITYLTCDNNDLIRLDLRKNIELVNLECNNNRALKALNLKNNNNRSMRTFLKRSTKLVCLQVDDRDRFIRKYKLTGRDLKAVSEVCFDIVDELLVVKKFLAEAKDDLNKSKDRRQLIALNNELTNTKAKLKTTQDDLATANTAKAEAERGKTEAEAAKVKAEADRDKALLAETQADKDKVKAQEARDRAEAAKAEAERGKTEAEAAKVKAEDDLNKSKDGRQLIALNNELANTKAKLKTTQDDLATANTAKDQALLAKTETERGKTEAEAALQKCEADNSITSIESRYEQEALTLYPNPAGESLNIVISGIVKAMTITDLAGITVKTIDRDIRSVDVSSIASGTYILHASTDSGLLFRKFVKQ